MTSLRLRKHANADQKDFGALAIRASELINPPNRYMPDPRELNDRLWNDAEFHTRLWNDPALRDAYVKVIDKALLDAVTGKEKMEKVAGALSDIVMTQVEGELSILGLRDHFTACLKPIKHIVLGMILTRMAEIRTRLQGRLTTDDPTVRSAAC